MSTSNINPSFADVRDFNGFVQAFENSPVPCKTKMGKNDYIRAWTVLGLVHGETATEAHSIEVLGIKAASLQPTVSKLNRMLTHVGVSNGKAVRPSDDCQSFMLDTAALSADAVPDSWGQTEEPLSFVPRGRPRKTTVSAPVQATEEVLVDNDNNNTAEQACTAQEAPTETAYAEPSEPMTDDFEDYDF